MVTSKDQLLQLKRPETGRPSVARPPARHNRWLRITVLRVLVLSMLITLGTRLWYLQVMEGSRYNEVAAGSAVRDVVTPAVRGLIVDDMGRPLVENRTSLVITVDRSALARQRDSGRAVLARVGAVLGQKPQDLTDRIRLCTATVGQPCWNGSPYQPVPIAEDVASERALTVIEHPEDYPGVAAEVRAVRAYPLGSLASHDLGYLSPASQDEVAKNRDLNGVLVGRSGLEGSYDTVLRGHDGIKRVAVDRFGRLSKVISEQAPVGGSTLVLSMDAKVQKVLEDALRHGIDRAHFEHKPADTAAGVVLDAQTGQVVALASVPGYDPAQFVGGISAANYQHLLDPAAGTPLISRAVQGSYPPGSTFKIVSASTAMTNMGATGDALYNCPSDLQVGNTSFHNFDSEALGPITLHEALVASCDTVFYKFAYDAWLQDGGLRRGPGPYPPANEWFSKMARAFGLGRPTGIDLPGETSGLVTDRESRQALWNQMKDTYCRRAKTGYPEDRDPARAAYLTKLASENCADGYLYRGGDATQFAIGQNVVDVSPLQLAVAYAAVANGGKVLSPRMVKAVIGSDGKVTQETKPVVTGHLPVAPETLSYIRDALAGVVTSGTASGAFGGFPLNVLPLAGKTGTAETYSDGDISWFASFGPVNNPRYVVLVVIPNSGQGARFAAPTVREVWEGIYGINREAALPQGQQPATLPCLLADGSVAPPPAPGRQCTR
ncbi:MAG: penicillin-binding protein 2 [Frankiaceae bacterium]